MEEDAEDGPPAAASALSLAVGLNASPVCRLQLLGLLRLHATLTRRRRQRETLERDRRLRQYLRRRRAFVLSSLAAIRSIIDSSKRSIWVVRRNSEDNLWSAAQSFDDEEWKAQFHVSRVTFDFVFSLIGPAIRRKRTSYRAPIEARRRLAIALWFYARSREYRHIAATFGVGITTVCNIVRQVTAAILAHVHPRFVSLPSGQRLDDAVRGFRARGYPQCAGAIGRVHVPIATPRVNQGDYVNKRGWHSMVLQAVVDHNHHFTDVYAGWPGSTSAASVLRSSELYMRAEDRPDGYLFPREKSVVIRGVEVPVHLVGDPSFPLRPWLMKAYGQRSGISSERRRFGRSLSSAQAVVGAAFSRLRGRWGYLLKRSEMDLSTLAKVVTACCVLHNVCEQCGDDFLPEWNSDAGPGGESHLKQPETEPHDEAASSTAEAIRDALSGCLLAMLQD